MNLYEISFPGLWLGGLAIIEAESEEKAIETLINNDPPELGDPKELKAKLLERPLVYIETGNY